VKRAARSDRRHVAAGTPLDVRFTWTRDGDDRARREQAVSYDNRATWDVNWTMDFTRRG
jgi:hypothetical protein